MTIQAEEQWRWLAAALAAAGAVAAGGAVLFLRRPARGLLCGSGGQAALAAAEALLVVVPGGGLTPEGKPTPWVRRRLQEAAKIYQSQRRIGKACHIALLSAGTPHKPMPVDPHSKFQVFEAEGNARSLIRDFAVPPDDIFEENWSLDTVGNAYLLRAAHTEVAGWRRLTVVNNEFHMERTRTIFSKVFGLPPVPAFGPYELDFVEVPDDGLEGEVLASRKKREARSTEGFRRNIAGVGTMQQLHAFLFTEHLAYAARRLLKDREPVDPKTLATY